MSGQHSPSYGSMFARLFGQVLVAILTTESRLPAGPDKHHFNRPAAVSVTSRACLMNGRASR